MYKGAGANLQLLLVHPGGPFWAKRDAGAWSIPKGEYAEGEEAFAAARREFAEEMGRAPEGDFWPLGEVAQPGRKRIAAWAVEGDFDVAALTCNSFEMEWPPNSGRRQSFPEVDRAQWFAPEQARVKILARQRPFIDRLLAGLAARQQWEDGKETGKRLELP